MSLGANDLAVRQKLKKGKKPGRGGFREASPANRTRAGSDEETTKQKMIRSKKSTGKVHLHAGKNRLGDE